jgi:hypothetical protein
VEVVARALSGVAATVKVWSLPESVGGAVVKDGTDFFSAFQDKVGAAGRSETGADQSGSDVLVATGLGIAAGMPLPRLSLNVGSLAKVQRL